MARFNGLADLHGVGEDVVCVTLGEVENSTMARADACRQFVIAAEQLLDAADANPAERRVNTLTENPICFLIRHAVELALKVALPCRGHRLAELLDEVLRIGGSSGLQDPVSFVELVTEYSEADPTGTLFRYASENAGTCCVRPVDLRADLRIILGAVDDYLVYVGEHAEGSN